MEIKQRKIDFPEPKFLDQETKVKLQIKANTRNVVPQVSDPEVWCMIRVYGLDQFPEGIVLAKILKSAFFKASIYK